MSLGAKSRRRRRPQADAGGHLPPRAFAPAPTSLQTQRFSLGPHVPGALRLPGLRGPGTKKPPQGGDFVTTGCAASAMQRSEEHTSELQSLMRISYAVFCLKK